jgi:hypothetical protein
VAMINPSALLIPTKVTEVLPTETIPVEEADAVAVITQGIEEIVRAGAATGSAHRDAHPKAHGCVEAEFRVLDGLPPEFAVGLFAAPRVYPAWIRFSNADGAPRPDKVGDARGAAVKVLDVEESRSGTQDFVMINNPRFFVRNAADYIAFQAAVSNQLKFFLPGLNPLRWRIHELIAGFEIRSGHPANPLNLRYWSTTPFLFGESVCKYSMGPASPPSPFIDRAATDFMRENLVRSLEVSDAEFDFCVQIRKPPMPVEDPTVMWPEALSPFVPVARITIPRQVFDTPDRIAFGEDLSFTPWHGLDAHRPLGGINRVRRVVYETISRLRHELNGVPRVEPVSR